MVGKKERIKKIFEYLKSIGRIHTQTDFAKAIGSTQATVSNMLSGEEKYVTDSLFRRIGYYFGDIFNSHLRYHFVHAPPNRKSRPFELVDASSGLRLDLDRVRDFRGVARRLAPRTCPFSSSHN